MRLSQYPINTMKETPAEAEVVSHQLMLRAGLIRRLAAPGLHRFRRILSGGLLLRCRPLLSLG